MIRKMRKLTVIPLIMLTFFALSSRAFATDETPQNTLKDSIYGGLIVTPVGSAVVLVSNQPGPHLDYVATGLGLDILGGNARNGVDKSVDKVEHGKFTLNPPIVKMVTLFDDKVQTKEVIRSIELLRVSF